MGQLDHRNLLLLWPTMATPDHGPPSRSPKDPTLADNSSIDSPDTADDQVFMPFAEYLALLVCPVCDAVFDAPTTLRCGHTVCTSHIKVYDPPPSPGPPTPPHSPPLHFPPSCPLPTCSPIPVHSPQLTVPSTSPVAYFPAPPASLLVQNRVRAEPGVDVTLAKIISLVRRAQREEQEWVSDDSETEDPPSPPLPPPASSSSTPNLHRPDRPTLTPLHFASGSRPRPPSTSPASSLRPRKRPKISGCRRTDVGYDGTRAELTDDPGRISVQARFEKDLLAEVTCEICFMLLFQPVTTPCQHVRSFPPLLPPTSLITTLRHSALIASNVHSTTAPPALYVAPTSPPTHTSKTTLTTSPSSP